MRRSLFAMLVAVPFLASACGGNPTRSYSSPAPANALDCALKTMAGLGYNPVQGGVADGYIKFERRTGASAGASAAGMLPGVGSPRVGDFITVTNAGSTLRITMVGFKGDGSATGGSAEAEGHVQAIIAGCGNPANATPSGT